MTTAPPFALQEDNQRVTELNGTVLMVSDVATTGRHIEMAVSVLREKASDVMAIAWFGANGASLQRVLLHGLPTM